MSQLITEELKAKSEYYEGDEMGRIKSKELLKEIDMPNGLLPLKDIIECGYHRESGFVWLKQKNKIEHRFEKIGKPVIYATEVTAYVENHKIKKLTGVKSKELMLWVNICDIYRDTPASDKLCFKTPTGLFRSFPLSAFEVEETEKEKEKDKETKEVIKEV